MPPGRRFSGPPPRTPRRFKGAARGPEDEHATAVRGASAGAHRRLPDLPGSGGGPAEHQFLRVGGYSVAWMPPLVLLAAIAVVDWKTSGEFRTISWVVLVPGIAAAICGLWTTIGVAFLAVLTYELEDNAWPHQFRTGVPDFILVVVGSGLAVLACAVRLRGERRMLHMQDIADTTRRTVLRPMPAGWGGIEHAAAYLAADSVARVGGDFYDIQPGPRGTRVLLGDVQGKGLDAVAAASALLGTFREAGYHELLLATVAERLETRMRRHVRYGAEIGRDDDDRFATAVLVGFPQTGAGCVEVINFGHEPPLVVTPDGVRSLPIGERLPLGLAGLTGGPAPALRLPLADEETLLLFTDGVSEARDAAGSSSRCATPWPTRSQGIRASPSPGVWCASSVTARCATAAAISATTRRSSRCAAVRPTAGEAVSRGGVSCPAPHLAGRPYACVCSSSVAALQAQRLRCCRG